MSANLGISTAEELEKVLMHLLCRKFSREEEELTTPPDQFATELLAFSRHFQDRVLHALYQFPATLIATEGLFLTFLNSVCASICLTNRDHVEKRFFVLSAFIINMTTLAFMMRCFRLIRNLATVLPTYLNQTEFGDLDVSFAFDYLKATINRIPGEREFLCTELSKVAGFVKTAGENNCSTLERQPNIATLVVEEHAMRAQNSANDAANNVSETCPYCNEICRPYLEPFLTEGNPADT